MALLIIGIILHKILEVNIVVFTHYVYLIAQHFKNEFILSTKKTKKTSEKYWILEYYTVYTWRPFTPAEQIHLMYLIIFDVYILYVHPCMLSLL